MAKSVKYIISDPNGIYIDWVYSAGGINPGGKEAVVVGGAGDDYVYVEAGSSADVSELMTGNDVVYLTGNLVDYTQSIDQLTGVYTLTRINGLAPGETEIIKFTVGAEDDVIYFADGHFMLNALNDGRLHDGTNFQPLQSTWLDSGGTSWPIATAQTTSTSATMVVISDPTGVDIPSMPLPGETAVVIGSDGNDTVYVKAGTSVDASVLMTGDDIVYMTGNLNEYSQSIDQGTGVYTFTRISGLPAGQVEVIKFTVGAENDAVYFRDGHIVINALEDSRLYDGVTFYEIDPSWLIQPGTPGLNPTTEVTDLIIIDDSGVNTIAASGDSTDDTTPTLQGNLTEALKTGESLVVYRSANGGAFTQVAELTEGSGVTTTAWTWADAGLANGTTYTYKAMVKSASGMGPESTPFSILVDTAPPAQAITIDSISNVNTGDTTDFITSDIGGLTIHATLDGALQAGDVLQYDNGTGWVNVAPASIVQNGAVWDVTVDDANLTATTTVKFRVFDGANAGTEASQLITIDTVAPVISSIAITSAVGDQNQFLNAGDVVTVTVTMSEDVFIDTAGGTPTLSLLIGATPVTATYSATNGNLLTFTYTILDGQTDIDGIAIAADPLSLNGATLKDIAANDAVLTPYATGTADAAYQVDTTDPLGPTAITEDTTTKLTNPDTAISLDDNSTPTTIRVAFNTSDVGVDGQIELLLDGASYTDIFLPAKVHTITATDVTNGYVDFTIGVDEWGADAANKTLTAKITDAAGNVGDVGAAVINFSKDIASPTVLAFTAVPATGIYGPGSAITIKANMSEVVQAGATIEVTLNNGVVVQLTTAANGNLLTGTYTIGALDSGQDIAALAVASYTIVSPVLDLSNNAMVSTALPATNIGNIEIDVTAPPAPIAPDLLAADDSLAVANALSSNTDNITSNTTGLTFSGTTENDVGTTVRVFHDADNDGTFNAGDVDYGIVTATAGSWSKDIALADINAGAGTTYNIRAQAIDAAGNTKNDATHSVSAATQITIDTSAINLSTTEIGGASSVNKTDLEIGLAEKLDGITISGIKEAGASVSVVWDDGVNGNQFTKTYTVPGDAGTSWSVTFDSSDLLDLTSNSRVTVTQTDLAGNTSTVVRALGMDTSTVPATLDPIGINELMSRNDVTLGGTAEPGAQVQLTLIGDVSILRISTVGPDGRWSLVLTPADIDALGEGEVNALMVSTDASGNSASSAAIIMVDTLVVTPTMDIITTNDQTPVINGMAEAGSLVTVTIQDTILVDGVPTAGSVSGTAIANEFGRWEIALGTDGVLEFINGATYAVSIATVDPAGNPTIDVGGNPTSIVIPNAITINTAAPLLEVLVDPLTDPLADPLDPLSGDGFVKDNTPTLNVKADVGSNILVSWNNGTTWQPAVAATGDWQSITAPTLADAVYTFLVKAALITDPAVFAQTSVAMTIDTVIATPLIYTVGGDNVVNNNDIINGVVIDGTGEANATLTLTVTGVGTGSGPVTYVYENIAVMTDGTWSYTMSNNDVRSLGDSASLVAVQQDKAGNISQPSDIAGINVIDVLGSTQTPPKLTNLSIGPDSFSVVNTTNDTTPNIVGTGAEPNNIVRIYVDSNNDGVASISELLGSTAADASGNWSIDLTGSLGSPLANGAYKLLATQINTAGNESIPSSPYTVVVDTVTAVPVMNAVAGNDVINLNEVNAVVDIALSGTAERNASVEIQLTGQSGSVTLLNADIVKDGLGHWTTNLTDAQIAQLGQGAVSVTVTATDTVGNVNTSSKTITIDTQVSSLLVDTLATPLGTPTITGSTEAGASVVVVIKDGLGIGSDLTLAPVVADSTGLWSATVPVALAQGSYSLDVTATDTASNTLANTATTLTILAANAAQISAVQLDVASDSGTFNNDRITNDTTPTLNITATTGAAISIDWLGDGNYIAVAGATGAALAYTYGGALPDGVRSINIKASLNGMDTLQSYQLTIDNTNPATPTVNALSTTDATPTITGTATLLAGETLSVNFAGTTYTVGDGYLKLNGSIWTLDVPNANALVATVDGTYAATATVTDLAGNVATAAANVVFSKSMNLSAMTPAQGLSYGTLTYHHAMAGGGDTNGDGFDDVMLGDNANKHIYLMSGAQANAATATLQPVSGSELTLGIGSSFGGVNFGFYRSMDVIGDFNGDGLADMIAADSAYNRAYIVYGGQAPGFVDVSALDSNKNVDGIVIKGSTGVLGTRVAAAGDFNGDGLADVLVYKSGVTLVIYGGNTSSVNVDYLAPTQGQVIALSTSFGATSVGDFNGDGYADLIGANTAGTGSTTGWAKIYLGGTGASALGLTVSNSRTNASIMGTQLGLRTAGVGDVNGDGYADVAVSDTTHVHVIYGNQSGTVDVGTMTASQGFSIAVSNANVQDDIAGLGDVNGDGLDDILIGDVGYNTSIPGQGLLVFGGQTSVGYTLKSNVYSIGSYVAEAGDVNGDGLADILISGAGVPYVYMVYGADLDGNASVSMGTAANDIMSGTNASDELVGGLGNDTLTGNGGADVLYGGAGNDRIVINADNLAQLIDSTGRQHAMIDGGNGIDTLALLDAGMVLDMNIYGAKIQGIEKIELSAAGAQGVNITAAGLRKMVEPGAGPFKIMGSSADTVNIDLTGETASMVATGSVYADGSYWNTYAFQNRQVWIQRGITVTGTNIEPLALTLTATSNYVSEGTNAFVITANAAVQQDITVQWAITGGTVEAADMVGGQMSGTVVIEAGTTSVGVARLFRDALIDFDNITVSISNPSYGTIAQGYATATTNVLGDISVTDMIAAEGLVLTNTGFAGTYGAQLAAVGDLNKDGYIDIASAGGARGFIQYGQSAYTETLNFNGGVNGVEYTNSSYGGIASIAGAGDVNGDGYADVIAGGSSHQSLTANMAYVFYTQPVQAASTNVNNMAYGNGFAVITSRASVTSVDGGGDFNGDGLADVMVGSTYAKEVYVVYGGRTGTATGFNLGSGGFRLDDQSVSHTIGNSIAFAGDFNGDGYDDMLASSQNGNRTFLVFGQPSGILADTLAVNSSSTNSLGAAVGLVVTGAGNTPQVAAAGDVNGDGLSDIIMGSATANRAYVLYGGISGTQAVSDSLASDKGLVLKTASGGLGVSVAGVGDFNGDGLDDLLVGSSGGRAYLVYGGQSGVIDLDTLTKNQGFTITGGKGTLGTTVSSVGDINGDGLADLLVGANDKEIYVIYGQDADGVDSVVFGTAGNDVMEGAANDEFVAGAGNDTLRGNGGADVLYGGYGDDRIEIMQDNLDTLLDPALKTHWNIDGGAGTDTLALAEAGMTLRLSDLMNKMANVEVIELAASGQTVTVDNNALRKLLPTGGVLKITGASGTVNLSDAAVLTGTAHLDGGLLWDTYSYAGSSYQLWVQNTVSVNQTNAVAKAVTVAAIADFGDKAVEGDHAFVVSLNAVALNDVVLTWHISSGASQMAETSGTATILAGQRTARVALVARDADYLSGDVTIVIDSATELGNPLWSSGATATATIASAIMVGDDIATPALAAAQGFAMTTASPTLSMGAGGDINGDGYADVLVSQSYLKSWAVFGNYSAAALDLSGAAGAGIYGNNYSGNANLQANLKGIGDTNGDGYADIAFGGAGNATTPTLGYAAFVSYGNQSGNINLATLTSGASGFLVRGNSSNTTVSAAGDVNGDGLNDFMVSQASNPIYDAGGNPTGQYSGTTWVVYGNTNRSTDLQLGSMTAGDGFTIAGGAAGINYFGTQMEQAGDFNGDGYDDVLVGTGSAGSGTNAYMVYGGPAVGGTTLNPVTDAFKINNTVYALTGGGDMNGDGKADIAVLATPVTNTVYVLYGGTGYTAGTSLNVTTMAASAGFAISGLSEPSVANFSLSNAGDVNGDGFDDLLIGSALHHRAYVIYGSATGVNVDVTTLTDAQGFSIQGTENALGVRVSAAGDVNGDGLADLMVSVADKQNDVIYGGNTNAGVVLSSNDRLANVADDLIGTAGNNNLLGGVGNDTLTGAGGADVLYGGQGNDRIVVNADNVANLNAAGARVDGGYGADTLALDGANITLDFSNIGYKKVIGIESIDLTGSGDNHLVMNLQDLLNLSDTSNALYVEGDAGDTVTLNGAGADFVSAGVSATYNTWHNASTGAWLYVDTDVTAVVNA